MKMTKKLFNEIRELILSARKTIVRGIDLVQVHTNFDIGRRIVEEEQHGQDRATYGEEIIKELAKKLAEEFGAGFSKSNLEYMRRFYLLYHNRRSIAQTGSGQLPSAKKTQKASGQFQVEGKRTVPIQTFSLSWSHYVFLMSVKNPEERNFYEIEATTQNWSLKELRRQFNTSLYERLALSRDKSGIRKLSQQGQEIVRPHDLLKEPLVLEFLGLDEKHGYSESDLETAIINHIEKFLLELGKGFLFEARQRRFTFDEDHFFVDLVFYNRLLRCYVLVDLKLGKLTHQDLGQMQMYVNYLWKLTSLMFTQNFLANEVCNAERRGAGVRRGSLGANRSMLLMTGLRRSERNRGVTRFRGPRRAPAPRRSALQTAKYNFL